MLKLTVCTWCQILRGWQLEPQIIPNNELQVRAKNFIERSILDDKRIFLKIWLKIFPWNFSPWPKNFTKIWEKTPFFLFLKLKNLEPSCFLLSLNFQSSTFDIRKKNGKNPGVSLKKTPGFGDWKYRKNPGFRGSGETGAKTLTGGMLPRIGFSRNRVPEITCTE